MIVTDVRHLPTQLRTTLALEQAIEFLRRAGWQGHADGRIPIDGNQVYGMLQSYETKTPTETVLFEGHRMYIDIQYIIEGKETIYWMPTSGLIPTTPYDEAKDVWLCQSAHDRAVPIWLSAGQLAVFFPEDAHSPKHMFGAPMRVRKIVIKVLVEP